MKLVDLDKIWKKFPNKYIAILEAARESRKIVDEQKPRTSERIVEDLRTAKIQSEVKVKMFDSAKPLSLKPERLSPDSQEEINADATDVTITSDAVVAEKKESNPYIAGLKRVIKSKIQ